jgi:hypothetical protein
LSVRQRECFELRLGEFFQAGMEFPDSLNRGAGPATFQKLLRLLSELLDV